MAQIPLVSVGQECHPLQFRGQLQKNPKKPNQTKPPKTPQRNKPNYDSAHTVIISSLVILMLVMLLVYWLYPFPLLYVYRGFPACLFLEFL